MHGLELPISEHHSVYKEPNGYKKFMTVGSSPLSDLVVEAALSEYIQGTKIDIVGIDSIANLLTISKILKNMEGHVRIFEPQLRYCDALIYHLKHSPYNNLRVQVFNEKYEDAAMKLTGTPAITIVDKTLLTATQPIKLLNALTFGGPNRKIILAGYGDYPSFNHRMVHGKSTSHTNSHDFNDGSIVYGGSCVPIYTILKPNTEYLFHKKFTINEGVVMDAMPKRVNNVVYERRPIDSIQTAVKNNEIIYDKRIWVRKRPTKNWVDIPKEVSEALISGVNELWISSTDTLSVTKVGDNDRKLMIGVYDLVEVVVWSKDIDTKQIRNLLPRKFYSSNQ